MKKQTWVCLLALACTSASAAKVTFIGSVTDNACTAVMDNSGSADSTVVLPPVSARELARPGATAGETAFTLSLMGCGAQERHIARAHFYSPLHASAEGRLVKAAGSGEGWDYELLPATGNTPLLVGMNEQAIQQASAEPGVQISGGSARLTYRVRYRRKLGALFNPGAITSTAIYVIDYK